MSARLPALALIVTVCAALVAPSPADAQAELTGTYVRYVGVGANGSLINSSGHSLQYTETGTAPYSCDAFYPGSPYESFTVEVVSPTPFRATNGQSGSAWTTVSGPTVSGRTITWTGTYASGGVSLRAVQTARLEVGDRHVTLDFAVTNTGSTTITGLYYLRDGEPDHGQCTIGSDYSTNNDVLRQPPTDTSALVTATGGSSTMVTLGMGAHDPRARAHASGYDHTDAAAVWAAPVDPAGALEDISIDLVFHHATLAPGASTTFRILYVFGPDTTTATSRFDALGGPCMGCTISGSCIAAGTTDPATVCRLCDPMRSTSAYSSAASGTPCDDGLVCTTTDSCDGAGTCRGTARLCNDSLSCTTDSCAEPGGCTAVVTTGCLIGGACIADGAPAPGDPCRACVPATSRSAYSARPSGTECGTSMCSGGTLTAAPRCDGSGACAPGSSSACSTGMCADGARCADPCTDDSTCGAAEFCEAGMCAPDVGAGAACTRPAQCSSGFCTGSICCNSVCAGMCDTCVAAGSEGTCTTIPGCGIVEGGVGGPDGGGGVDAGPRTTGRGRSRSGCGCRVPGEGRGEGAPLSLLFVAAVAASLRRRRRH